MHSYIKIPFDNHITAIYTQGRKNDWKTWKPGEKGYYDIAEDLKLNVNCLFKTKQMMQDDVCIVNSDMAGDGVIRNATVHADAAVTSVAGIALCMLMSDCPPVYLYDPKRRVIGLVHSGRQGTGLNIVTKTINVMCREFDCDPSDIKAVIGPHICEKCYEVGEDVAREFALNFPEEARSSVVSRKYGRLTINLSAAITYQLNSAGIQPENLTYMKECTYENPDLLSYRGGDGTRSNLAVMALRVE